MGGLGHNQGPTMEAGYGWRKHCWSRARADLIPHLPIEIVRLRMARAKEIGLDYRTYASVRAASGRDVIAFLFSSNALRLVASAADLPGDRVERLKAAMNVGHLVAAHRPIDPNRLPPDFAALHQITLKGADRAPLFTESWSAMRVRMERLVRQEGVPADGIILVGDTAFEREWLAAGRFGGYIAADTYFPGQAETR
jgi:hypothetical protein